MKTCAEPHAGGGKGYPDAQFFLAECYRKGAFGSVKNLDKAFALYTKASKLGHAPSAYYRGLAFELGLGTKVNEKKALELFRTAASAGVTAAALKLGVVYQRGLLKQKANEATALLWLKRAAADAATAAQVVATANTGDDGGDDSTTSGEQDEAAKALKLAALASRNVYALHACWLLGMHYEKSSKAEDREAAFHFFLDAAELQYPPAAFKVAMCLRDGVGVDADHEQAAQWFEAAKANGVSNLAQITNLPLPT
ncbi:hypothetical protein BCR44DRAFT_131188 [Catenaria anguillulae PL171]|uniref:HCP-like protein n=1 Tax=Catenaria anguillulae PL171 TaxID=765915 RepID=A0A1Y2I089_9FUNG|nr:hypothetical protein BCR44DRAFT_131188 [Catenaria anguillulae PL171]